MKRDTKERRAAQSPLNSEMVTAKTVSHKRISAGFFASNRKKAPARRAGGCAHDRATPTAQPKRARGTAAREFLSTSLVDNRDSNFRSRTQKKPSCHATERAIARPPITATSGGMSFQLN